MFGSDLTLLYKQLTQYKIEKLILINNYTVKYYNNLIAQYYQT